jgi:hypothetical protein
MISGQLQPGISVPVGYTSPTLRLETIFQMKLKEQGVSFQCRFEEGFAARKVWSTLLPGRRTPRLVQV